MNLSDNGLKKIESYEGYGKAMPDGSCMAYQDKFHGHLDVPTIGFGCTVGVEMGMVWTRAEADAKRVKIATDELGASFARNRSSPLRIALHPTLRRWVQD